MIKEFLVILYLIVILAIFLGLVFNGQIRKIIADLFFGRM
jgi:hypothetical protein